MPNLAADLLPLTVPEIRHLLTALVGLPRLTTLRSCAGPSGDDAISTLRIGQFKASHHAHMGPITQPVNPFADTP